MKKVSKKVRTLQLFSQLYAPIKTGGTGIQIEGGLPRVDLTKLLFL